MIGGLKNAVEHGSSLESAKLSFISAGYSREEVEEASRNISGVRLNSSVREEDIIKAKPLPQQGEIVKPKFFTKKRVLIFIMITLMILVGALFLGLAFA